MILSVFLSYVKGYPLFQTDSLEKIYNTHIVINNTGKLVAAYRKLHLFDIDNKDTGLRLMESDYVLKGTEIVPPVCTPIGKLGLNIVSLIETSYISIFSTFNSHRFRLTIKFSVTTCGFPSCP